jgi:hypothetical protein
VKVGSEENGSGEEYRHPALILKRESSSTKTHCNGCSSGSAKSAISWRLPADRIDVAGGKPGEGGGVVVVSDQGNFDALAGEEAFVLRDEEWPEAGPW